MKEYIMAGNEKKPACEVDTFYYYPTGCILSYGKEACQDTTSDIEFAKKGAVKKRIGFLVYPK